MSCATSPIPGFVPTDEKMFQCASQADLRESAWMPCEFRFRGFIPEIEKLRKYLQENSLKDFTEFPVSDQIREIRIVADDKTMELIEKFPAIKVTGLAENWDRYGGHGVYAVYSESGFP